MVYPFRCECGQFIDEWRSVSECAAPAYCPTCGKRMVRIYTVPSAVVTKSYFDHGLGKVVTSGKGVREELRRIEGATGKRFEEVGTSSARVKKAPSEVKFSDKEMSDMHQMLTSVEN